MIGREVHRLYDMYESRVMPEPVGELRIDVDYPRPETTVLTVHGDADLFAAPELRERLAAAIDQGAAMVIVDLSDVSFVDSVVLGALLGGLKRARARGSTLRLVVPRAELRRIFEITLLDRLFVLDNSRQEALAAVG